MVIEPTDSSTGRRRFLGRAIVSCQATLGAAAAFVFGATTRSPTFPQLPDCVVARQHIRVPVRIGLPFLGARKDAGRMRKDQCVAFRLHF
jgi:hypothetical protein